MLFTEKRLHDLVSLYRGSLDATESTIALLAQELLTEREANTPAAFTRGVVAGAEYVFRCLPLIDKAIIPELRKNLPLIVDSEKPLDGQ
jgi:hypothetical protein